MRDAFRPAMPFFKPCLHGPRRRIQPWLMLGALLAALLWAVTLRAAPAPPSGAAREKLDVVVLLDNSGSMLRENGRPGNDAHFTRLTAVQYLVEKMAPGDRIALVTFDSTVHTDPDALARRVLQAVVPDAALQTPPPPAP